LLYLPNSKKEIFPLIRVYLIALIFFAPWLYVLRKASPPIPYSYPPIKNILATFATLSIGELRLEPFSLHVSNLSKILFTITIILNARALSHYLWSKQLRNRVNWLLVPTVVIILILEFGSFFGPFYNIRSLIFFAPIFLGLIASVAILYKKNLFVLVVISYLVTTIQIRTETNLRGPRFKELAQQVCQRQNTAVIHESALTFYPTLFYCGTNQAQILEGDDPLSLTVRNAMSITPEVVPKNIIRVHKNLEISE
jgi:hypothetical protein